MKRVLVLSDTHVPRSAPDLPQEIYEAAQRFDMILHAGDFVEKELYEKLKVLREIRAVRGNMDSGELTHILKNKEIVQIGKFKIGLIHGYGAPADIIDTVAKEFKNVDAVVFGHSHEAVNLVRNGVLFFNPGSPTDKVFARSNSYGVLEIDDNAIKGRIIKL